MDDVLRYDLLRGNFKSCAGPRADPPDKGRTIPSRVWMDLRQIDEIDEDPSRNSGPLVFEDVGHSTTRMIHE